MKNIPGMNDHNVLTEFAACKAMATEVPADTCDIILAHRLLT